MMLKGYTEYHGAHSHKSFVLFFIFTIEVVKRVTPYVLPLGKKWMIIGVDSDKLFFIYIDPK